MTALGFFAGVALLALTGLCALAADEVPRLLGTLTLVLTLAALAAAIPH
ncbi:hypothetical protein [Streptomyces sp. NPDC008121]